MTSLRLAASLAGLSVLACSTQPAPAPSGDSPAAAEHQVMVTYSPAPPSLWERKTRELENDYDLRTLWSWTMTSLGEQCVIFELADARRVDAVIRRLSSDPRVGSVQRVSTFEARGDDAYNDPYAHLQHNAQTLRLGQAHRWATGKGVKVAVVDTGIDIGHPDLKGRIAVAQSFVDRGEQTFTSDVHGTAVAGVLAAVANNEIGIVGVAPNAEVLALKACWPRTAGARDAVCTSYTLAKALDFAIANRAQVVNLSLSGPDDPLLARLLKAALARGITVIAANGGSRPTFPANLEGVLAVSALGLTGPSPPPPRQAAGPLVAPAVDVLTTVPHAAYDFFSGSSVAAAQVSGIAALLLERNPHITPAQIAALLRQSATALSDGEMGTAISRVDACAALATALGTGGCD